MAFAATAFVTSAMAAHLPGIAGRHRCHHRGGGHPPARLLGPAEVAARIAEFGIAHRMRIHPLLTARVATALHPVGANIHPR